MYRALRWALFLVAPERIHTWVFASLRTATAALPARRVLARWLAPHDPVLASTVFGVRFAIAGLVVFILGAIVICRAFPAEGAEL